MIKNGIKFILFLCYTIGIFALKTPWVILGGIGINLICMIIFKISYQDAVKNLWTFMGFIVLTGMVNSIVVDLYYGGVICAKLILVCNMTYIFSKSMSSLEFAETIAKLLTPFKLFGVHVDSIRMIIYIALAFFPILRQELEQITFSFRAKGSKTDSFHLILQAKWVLLPVLTSILKRVSEIEYGLKAKAYDND